MSASSRDPVEADLDRQAEALRTRVRASGLYTHEVPEFEIARRVHRRIAAKLHLEDLGTLTTPESRNIVRKVRQPDGSTAVLKVIGNMREPGEAEALREWARFGLPCVRPLRWGDVPASPGEAASASYLLTEYIDRPTLVVEDGCPPARRAEIVQRLTSAIAPFHAAAARPPERSRTWAARVGEHLRWTLPLVRREKLAEPPGWADKLTEASATQRRLLHGDVGGANALVMADESLVLLDPPGAIIGPPEADVGHIVAYVACAGSHAAGEKTACIGPLLDVACATTPSLDPKTVALFAAVDLITWAGYFLSGHENRFAGSTGRQADGTSPADEARTYLGAAVRLLGTGQA